MSRYSFAVVAAFVVLAIALLLMQAHTVSDDAPRELAPRALP
jgi:hypothetical protein